MPVSLGGGSNSSHFFVFDVENSKAAQLCFSATAVLALGEPLYSSWHGGTKLPVTPNSKIPCNYMTRQSTAFRMSLTGGSLIIHQGIRLTAHDPERLVPLCDPLNCKLRTCASLNCISASSLLTSVESKIYVIINSMLQPAAAAAATAAATASITLN